MKQRLIKFSQCQPINIKVIEEEYNAKYVGDFCIKGKYVSWSNFPVSIFWQETPPVEGYSNYFGVYVEDDKVFITDGSSAFSEPIEGIVADDGEVIYSRYRHDMVSSADGSVSIDGGRDYTKISGNIHNMIVHIVPDGSTLKIVTRNNNDDEMVL